MLQKLAEKSIIFLKIKQVTKFGPVKYLSYLSGLAISTFENNHVISNSFFSYNVGPCSDVDYATLDDPKRNRDYNGGYASPSCDQNAVQGDWKGGDVWYRFAGPAGSQLADSIVPTSHCGTHATGWLNGAHPVFLGENVTRQVCFHWNSNSCMWNTDVDIKQCGGFYIYKFKAVPGCDFKYCGQ